VTEHLVDDDAQSEPVCFVHHLVEIRKRAEHRVDIAIVGHVVTEILHRRGKERRKPYRIHTQIGHMAQPFRYAGNIADPVIVGILKRARVDLVDHGAPPPVGTTNIKRAARCRVSVLRHRTSLNLE